MKTPAYYKAKPNDIDRSLLTVIPEAPRVPQQGLHPGYDWNMLADDTNQTNVTKLQYKRKFKTNLLLSYAHRITILKRASQITRVILFSVTILHRRHI